MFGRNDENIQGVGYPLSRGLGRGLRRALGACLTVAALVAATAGGAYADDHPATGDTGTTAGATRKDVDGDTRYTYTGDKGSGVLGDETSTRYSGRVWTDKTVTTEDQTFTNPNDSEGQTTTPVTVQNDSDFLVTYSALATSTETSRQRPTDTVFVLDFSMTMGQRMDGSEINADPHQVDQTRMFVMLNALEDAMQDLKKANTSNRIGIVVFLGYLNDKSQTERVLLPLTQVTEFNTRTPSGDSVYTTPDGFFTITKMVKHHPYSKMGVECNLPRGTELWTGNYTPTQAGLYDAMQMLLDAEVTSGQERQPNVVLMSDGATNAISVNTEDDTVWYEDVDTGDTGARITDIVAGASSSPFAAFATVLMGSYLDEKVEEHYDRDNSVYTIGVTGNSSSDQIRFALDPEPYLSETIIPSSDPYKVVAKSSAAIDEYLKGGDTVTVQGGSSRSATFKIVKDDEERVVPQDFDYVDTYYEAHKADDLENAFADIAGNIISRARYPIDTTGTSDGYITYEDPIGEYMQVKEVKTLLYMGADAGTPTKIETDTNGNKVTTYTFNHKFTSPVDDKIYDTSQIIIKLVETTTDHRQTLKVMIPYQAIPMRVNSLTLNSDGTVSNNIVDGNLPLRLCYTVGLRDGINPETLEYADGSQAVSDGYIQANTADQGRGVHLYSNDFNRADGTTTATATAKAKVTFTPAKDNPFYFIQEDTPLYTDEECKTHATEVTDNGTYYFRITYYQGTEKETAVVERAGSLMSGYVKEKNGAMYLQKGAPRLGYLQDLTALKDDNLTGTALTYREPTFEGDPRTGRFVVYLGNNGRMTLKPTMDGKAQIDVRKTLEGRPWTENDAFTFIITPQNGAPLPDKGDDIIVNQDSATLTVRAPQVGGTTGIGSFTVTIPSDTEIPEKGMQYVYKIAEQKGGAPSMDYDAGTLTVTITVTADGEDPDLRLDTVVAYQYPGAETGDTDPDGEFTNTFTPVSKLPFTGGRGTGLAVLLGGIVLLMLAGGAWLLARRNRN